MLSKDNVIKAVANFPDKFSLDELIERLILLDKIEKGMKDSDKGNTLTEEELDKKIKGWSK